MKKTYYLFILALITVAGCSPYNDTAVPDGNREFFTPRKWQVPISKEQAQAKTEPVKKAEKQKDTTTDADDQMTGYASWYGPGFEGNKTASGELYNPDEMTAAHKVLPMNTWVQVTNLENDRSVVVRINDRGPFKKDRVIDLSRKGADALGFLNQGTTKVTLKVIRYPKDYIPEEGLEPYKQTVVQIAVFSTQQRAQTFTRQLSMKYKTIPFIIETKNDMFYVLAGPYKQRDKAASVSSGLKAEGIENFVRSYRK